MWRREHSKLFDGSLNNHFRSNFFIITHYKQTEMMIFFIYDLGTNPEWVKYFRFT